MDNPLFFLGSSPSQAWKLGKKANGVMVSVNTLTDRRSDFRVGDWIMDSGAFTRISSGRGHLPVDLYAKLIQRWAHCGRLLAAVAQDFMCEPFIIERTGLSVEEHQRLTVEYYDSLLAVLPGNTLPVSLPVSIATHENETVEKVPK